MLTVLLRRYNRCVSAPVRAPLWSLHRQQSLSFRQMSSSASDEEKVEHLQRATRLAIKAAFVTWVVVKGWETFNKSGTFLLESTLTLLRSRHPETQYEAVSRLGRWHNSDEGMLYILKSNHLVHLLHVLSSPNAAARTLALEVLCRMATLDAARAPLRDAHTLSMVRASCTSIGDIAEARKCHALGDKLAQLLDDAELASQTSLFRPQ